MDFLNVMDHQSVRLWLAQSITIFFLVSGVILLLTGIGLFFNGAGTLQFFGRMNRWVSLRRATKPIETMRDTRPLVQAYRYWLAAIFMAGGAFALYGLMAHFDARAVIHLLGLDYFRADVAAWLAESLRWILIVGNVVAVAIGVMLAFFPAALVALEARGGRWFSQRQAARGADTMRVTGIDNWVAASPRAAGVVIALFALGLIGAFALLLPGMW